MRLILILFLSTLVATFGGKVDAQESVQSDAGQTGAGRAIANSEDASPSDVPQRVAGDAKPLPEKSVLESKLPIPPPALGEVADETEADSAEFSSDSDSSAVEQASASSVAQEVVKPALRATAKDPISRDLQEIAIRAVGSLDAERLPKVDSAKASLQNAITSAENYFGIGSQRGAAWADFLRIDELREELEKEKPSFVKLAELEMNMRQNYVGLENGPMLELRRSLSKFRRAVKYGSNADYTIGFLEEKLSELVDALDEPVTGSGAKRAEEVGLVATYLHECEQTPWAVEEMRRKFAVPNVQVYARENLINRFLSRAVAEPSPVNECILGTRVVGRAILCGAVSADVVPMAGGVSMKLNMSANLTSDNTGYNRGVVLRTSGSSPVYASKQIYVTPNGISSTPASVSTNLMTQINAIEHRLRIVRRIAKKKAAEQKPQADAIAQGRMQTKVRTQYDQQVSEQLADANVQLATFKQKQESRPEFARLEIPRPTYAVYSTDSTVNADVVQADTFQLAASEPCRIPRPSNSEIVVELHQSVLINALESYLADRTIHHHDVDDLAMQFLGEVPEEIKNEVDADPWTLTMASYNPIQFEFDENQIRLTIRFARLEGNDRSLPRGATVSVVYNPSYRRGVFTLKRDGDLEITVRGVSGVRATALRSAVKAKLDPIFQEKIVTDKLDLKTAFPNAPDLVLNWIKIDDGWLQIGVR